MFTAKDVMTLREMSGAGMMDCKKALVECDGNMDAALEYLQKKSLAASAKKASRIAAEGVVGAAVSGSKGAMIEINCETDFVAKTDDFKALVNDFAKHILATKSSCEGEGASIMDDVFTGSESTVSEKVNAAVAKIGEKISVRRFVCFDSADSIVDCYIHMGGKIGVLVEAECIGACDEAKTLLHDIAMHIAAAKPICVSKNDVDNSDLDKEREILRAQALNEPKPKPMNIIEKMVEGRIEKYYKEICLLEQPFVKDADNSVAKIIEGKLKIVRFVRYEMGEGLEKRQDDFAAEVMGQMQK